MLAILVDGGNEVLIFSMNVWTSLFAFFVIGKQTWNLKIKRALLFGKTTKWETRTRCERNATKRRNFGATNSL
jgi:hypothetical protein